MKYLRIHSVLFFLILSLLTTPLAWGNNCKKFDKNVTVSKLLCACRLLVKTCATICGSLAVNGKTFFNGDVIFNGNISGNVTIDGDLNVNGNTFLHQNLTVDGDTSLKGDLDVDGNTTLHGTLTVDQKVSLQDDLEVDGNTTLHGTLTVDGKVSLQDELIVDGDATFGSDVTIDGDLTVDGKIFADFFGNVVRVDKVLGDDATGERNGSPFLTINAALAVAQAGDMVWIFPGTYDETFTIPADVAVVGTDKTVVTIRQLNVTADTDMVTMGENSSLESVSVELTSAEHHQLRGIVLPGTTSKTSQIRNVCITINNSSASIVGSSNVYGINSIGTGVPDNTEVCVANTAIDVRSIGNGNARGILVNTANTLIVRDTEIIAIGVGGGGSFIGAETANVNAELELNFSSASGTTADISQTLGTLAIEDTKLINYNANGFGFTANPYPNTMVFADSGTLPGGTRYMRPGTDTPSTSEIVLPFAKQAIIKSLTVRSRVAPGAGDTDTWTLRKNGVNTALQVQLSGAATFVQNNSVSVAVTPSDLVSVQVLEDPTGSSTNDPVVIIEIY